VISVSVNLPCFALCSMTQCVLRTPTDDSVELMKLTYVPDAGLDSVKACLPGTRTAVLETLEIWVHDPKQTESRVRFLLGVAGSGKSAIAHSIASYFRDPRRGRRLASFFAFNRTNQTERHPHSLLRTIAADLADWNSDFKKALAMVISRDGSLARTNDITAQWTDLILEPIKHIAFVGPVLIVIDAFDECSSPDEPSRRLLLKTLLTGANDLPSNFRVLITSRPEKDVHSSIRDFQISHHVDHFDLHLYIQRNKAETDRDITLYIRDQLCHELLGESLDEQQVTLLVEKSEGLFQWAFTACAFIRQRNVLPLKEAFDKLVDNVGGDDVSSLDGLYTNILRLIFPSGDKWLMARFQSVMAQLLSASQPLSIDALNEIRQLGTDHTLNEVAPLVQNMGALLSGVDSSSSPIRPLHTSFRDFLTIPKKSKDWCVDLRDGHDVMSLGSVRVMNQSLHFNICRLETSYSRNSDFNFVAIEHVPERLRYAACYWGNHISSLGTLLDGHGGKKLRAEIRAFLRENLLPWLELLSMLGHTHGAATSLSSLAMLFTVIIAVASKALHCLWMIHRTTNTETTWPSSQTPSHSFAALHLLLDSRHLMFTFLPWHFLHQHPWCDRRSPIGFHTFPESTVFLIIGLVYKP
jgi:hypothetical protein